MKFDMFSEVQLTEDLPESNLSCGTRCRLSWIIVLDPKVKRMAMF
jgi:hypothetical protein